MSTAPLPEPEGRTWTIDELASHFGLTVRTTRYYAGLGLIPPPIRRGRMAYYDERHRARLEIVRTLQDQGMTLSAIEAHLAHLDETTSVPELEMRRALLSGWAPTPPEVISPEELNRRAGRVLDNEQLGFLQRLTAISPVEGGYTVRPTLNVGLQLLDVDLSIPSLESAGEAIRRHMESLALELREILRIQVINPLREQEYDADPAEFARTMAQLRQLTLEAVVSNFQQAANGLVDGSLLGPQQNSSLGNQQGDRNGSRS